MAYMKRVFHDYPTLCMSIPQLELNWARFEIVSSHFPGRERCSTNWTIESTEERITVKIVVHLAKTQKKNNRRKKIWKSGHLEDLENP